MNAREKFNAAMNFEKGCPVPKVEYGYWVATAKRFIEEGMPVVEPLADNISERKSIMGFDSVNKTNTCMSDKNIRQFFRLDSYVVKFPINVSPMLKTHVIKEDDETITYTDEFGITQKEIKDSTGTPLAIARPISNRKNWENYKSYYDSNYSKRLPESWDILKTTLRSRQFPMRVGGYPYGFFGMPRHLMGDTRYFMMIYDDPGLIKDMNDFFLKFIMDYWSCIFDYCVPDCCLIWEDMCFKGSAMMSTTMFKEFLSPYYLRLTDFLHQYKIKNIIVDSDGFVEELIPLWLDAGVTGLLPFEIQAGNDLLRIRQNFPELQILGGVNKMVLQEQYSEAEIDKELGKVKKLLVRGGYIPHIDHHVSADACWKNFKYYRQKLNNIIDSLAD